MNELAALLTLSAIHNHDRVGMILWSDRVEQILQPRKGRQHALRLLTDLVAVQPRNRGSDPAPALDVLLHMARRRVLVLMLSDFLFDMDREQLGAVAFRHDLVGIAVNHPSEIEPPPCGLAAVRDCGDGRDAGRGLRRHRTRHLQAARSKLGVPACARNSPRSGPICWNSIPAPIARRNWPGSSVTASGGPPMKPEDRPGSRVFDTKRSALPCSSMTVVCCTGDDSRADDGRGTIAEVDVVAEWTGVHLRASLRMFLVVPGEPMRLELTVQAHSAASIRLHVPGRSAVETAGVRETAGAANSGGRHRSQTGGRLAGSRTGDGQDE